MLRKASKIALVSAVAFSGALVAQGAGATQIDQWDYTITSGFSSFSSTGTGEGSGVVGSNDNSLGNPTQLSWTDDRGRTSNIAIDGNVSGTDLVTNSAGVAGATFTHTNHVISEPTNQLSTFQLDTNLDLTANRPDSVAGATPDPALNSIAFNGFFRETPNQAGTCSVDDGGPACSDIFVLTNPEVGFVQGESGQFVLTQDFTTTEDGLYTALLSIDGLGVLETDVCNDAGASAGCIGLTTFEENTNQYTTNLRIVSREAVPEPGSLLMLAAGVGLVGFGFVARRRRNSQQG